MAQKLTHEPRFNLIIGRADDKPVKMAETAEEKDRNLQDETLSAIEKILGSSPGNRDTASRILTVLNQHKCLKDMKEEGVRIADEYLVKAFNTLHLDLQRLSEETNTVASIETIEQMLQTFIERLIEMQEALKYIEGVSEHVEIFGSLFIVSLNYKPIIEIEEDPTIQENLKAIDRALQKLQGMDLGAQVIRREQDQKESVKESVKKITPGVYLHTDFYAQGDKEQPLTLMRLGILFGNLEYTSPGNQKLFDRVIEQSDPCMHIIIQAIKTRIEIEKLLKK